VAKPVVLKEYGVVEYLADGRVVLAGVLGLDFCAVDGVVPVRHRYPGRHRLHRQLKLHGHGHVLGREREAVVDVVRVARP